MNGRRGPGVRRLEVAAADACVALEIAACDSRERFPLRTWRRTLGWCQQRGTAVVLGVWGPQQVLAGLIVLRLRQRSRTVRIEMLAVDPGWRRRGLATRLVRLARRHLPSDCDQLALEVRTDNQPAIALYRRIGFTPGELLPDHYAVGVHGRRYRRRMQELR